VTLDDFAYALTSEEPGSLVATPDPLARIGRPTRFIIAAEGTGPRGHVVRLGEASAVIHVLGESVRARRPIAAGRTLAAGDLEVVTGPMEGLPLRRVPSMPELIGARLTRRLAAGAPIAADAVAVAPMVRAGDAVRVSVRQQGVEAATTAVAAESAGIDRVIRVVNPNSRRVLRARVIAAGEVEVVDER
jgi:flagellar basal body P-ring formation protein FlgA